MKTWIWFTTILVFGAVLLAGSTPVALAWGYGLSVGAAPGVVCVGGGTSSIIASAFYGFYPVTGHLITFEVTSGSGSVSPSSCYTDFAGVARSTYTSDSSPCSATITATDMTEPGQPSDSVTVKVCKLTLSSSRGWIEYGCGATQPCAFVTCTLATECPDNEPTFSTTGPLNVQNVNKVGDRVYVATVCSTAPTGCQQDGTVTAQNSLGCPSDPVTITVKQLGPFTFTHTGTDSPVYYYGGLTFEELDEPPPYGCAPDDFAYGCVTKIHYELCIECPLPTAKDFSETLEDGLSCDCGPTNAWSTALPSGYSGCDEVTDSIGVITCSCDDLIFLGQYRCKRQQSISIGDCELAARCIGVVRESPAGNCSTLTQTVYITDGWSGCNCL